MRPIRLHRVLPNIHPPPRIAAARRQVWDALVVVGAILLYFLVRGLVAGREAAAFAHATDLIVLERRLGIFWEPTLQAWALARPPLPTVMNWVYIWGHWPVVGVTLLWLLVAHRPAFRLYRDALLISGALGLVIFTLYPVAPPRFVEALGVVDTVTLHSEAYRVLQPPSLTNQYAAMPSLHVGWNLLVGIAVVRHASWRAARLFGFLMPAAMVAAVVLTANHYLLDAVAGGALALLGLAIARTLAGFSRWTSRRRRSAATAPGGSVADDHGWTPPGARAPGSRPTEPGSLAAY